MIIKFWIIICSLANVLKGALSRKFLFVETASRLILDQCLFEPFESPTWWNTTALEGLVGYVGGLLVPLNARERLVGRPCIQKHAHYFHQRNNKIHGTAGDNLHSACADIFRQWIHLALFTKKSRSEVLETQRFVAQNDASKQISGRSRPVSQVSLIHTN